MTAKILHWHLQRKACVYVRQSTMRQVLEHRESTERQYALVQRAVRLGWDRTAIELIDEDQGRSGASAEGRSGFARVASGVANGTIGAVFAVEVSRLARSSRDWQRLLSLCSVTGVLVIDEHSVYDPDNGDDKLLLDLKGTMSEAELRWIGLRMNGGKLNKAKRGELGFRPPAGYLWEQDHFVLDPDESIRQAIRIVFERFAIESSARAVVRWARETGFKLPTRRWQAGGSGEVRWVPLTCGRLYSMLHSPIYAGAYAWGRRRATRIIEDGNVRTKYAYRYDPSEWTVCIQNAHQAYISWDTYRENVSKLEANAAQIGRAGAPRNGAALLGGLLICGQCGKRMTARYGKNSAKQWRYNCRGDVDRGGGNCWSVAGFAVDQAVEELFLQAMTADELDVTLAVERYANDRAEEMGRQWRLRLEQIRHEAALAERRYKAVDPDNRVVARTLESQWEERLREVEDVERQFQKARREHRVELSAADRTRIRELARDLPAVWRSPTTRPAERKTMLGIAIEAITIRPVDVPSRQTHVQLQWSTGAVSECRVGRPDSVEHRRTSKRAVARLQELSSDALTCREIATRLNAERLTTGMGKPWTVARVQEVMTSYGITRDRTHADARAQKQYRLPERREDGKYSVAGAARRLGVCQSTIMNSIRKGLLPATREPHGTRPSSWWITLDDNITERFASRPQAGPSVLPDRDDSGRYSVPGLARALGVSIVAVHHWLRKGRVRGSREPYGRGRRVWWIELTDEQLEQLRHRKSQPISLPDSVSPGVYSTQTAAKILGVSQATIYNWVHAGYLPKEYRLKNRRRVLSIRLDSAVLEDLRTKRAPRSQAH
jgi:excisionase family DNA binding protein